VYRTNTPTNRDFKSAKKKRGSRQERDVKGNMKMRGIEDKRRERRQEASTNHWRTLEKAGNFEPSRLIS